jgi:hypothetical protein
MDIVIPYDSCHPLEHKMSSINYLLNRVNTYPISNEAKKKELNIIKNTLHNNKYNTDPQHQKPEWATFTYSGKETRKITKLFKDTKIKIAFRTGNTKQYIVRQHLQTDKYSDGGIYQMKCLDCPLKS